MYILTLISTQQARVQLVSLGAHLIDTRSSFITILKGGMAGI